MVEPADHVEVLEAGQVLVDGRVLAREPDPLANLRRLADDVEARDVGGAFIGSQQGGQDSDSGRLAGAVRAQQAEDAPCLGAEVHAAEGFDLAVSLAQAGGLDGGRHPLYASGCAGLAAHPLTGRVCRSAAIGRCDQARLRAPKDAQ